MSLCCECCVSSSRILCVGLVTRPDSPTECGVPECNHESSIMRRPWSTRGGCATEKNLQCLKDYSLLKREAVTFGRDLGMFDNNVLLPFFIVRK